MAKKAKTNARGGARARNHEQRRASERAERRAKLLKLSVAGLIVLVIGTVALWPRSSAAAVPEARLNDDPVVGAEGAPIVITEYADFGCPACRAWHTSGIRERILQTYGDKVQFVWRDFPVITSRSPKAAEAGQCAHDQGAFWSYHDLVYESGLGLDIDALTFYAEKTGLDTEAFAECLNTGRHQATVERDLTEARRLGLRGTPSFLVGERVLPGPPRYEQLVIVIDEALGE